MSDYYKQPTWSLKHKNLNFINAIVGVHDLYCMCEDSLKHTVTAIIKQEPSLRFNKEESKQIQQCLTTGDHGEDIVDDFGDGELERLFEKDFGEDDAEEDDSG
ncbi:MAG: hypothetical protein [Anelloviridae sp.]|nr:MAG: hypothetical protein [Anelloviridae sp.]